MLHPRKVRIGETGKKIEEIRTEVVAGLVPTVSTSILSYSPVVDTPFPGTRVVSAALGTSLSTGQMNISGTQETELITIALPCVPRAA